MLSFVEAALKSGESFDNLCSRVRDFVQLKIRDFRQLWQRSDDDDTMSNRAAVKQHFSASES